MPKKEVPAERIMGVGMLSMLILRGLEVRE